MPEPPLPPPPAAPPAADPNVSRRMYVGILCMLALSFMLFQIAILRELRFQLTTLFTLTPFLFSSVIVCIAMGSLFAGRIRGRSHEVLRWSMLLLPLLTPALFAATLGTAHALVSPDSSRFHIGETRIDSGSDAYLQSTFVLFVAAAVAGYGGIFFLQGLIFSIYFREGRERGILSDLYGADLVASGIGALAGGALNFFLTPTRIVLASAGVFLLALWLSHRYLGIRRSAVALVSLVCGAVFLGESGPGWLSRLENPSWVQSLSLTHWSRYRRIDVTETPTELTVFTDGMPFHLYSKGARFHVGDPRNLPVLIKAKARQDLRDVLVIGGGTGADVRILRDLVPDPGLRITAVELDGGFIDVCRRIPWLWEYYRTARIVVQEGRYFLENDREQYDQVIYAYIDPQSAIGSIGLPDANFLYTDAGLRAAYARVREGGYLIVSRVYLESEQDVFKRRMCATLQAAGIPPEFAQVYRLPRVSEWGYYGKISALQVVVRKGGPPVPVNDPHFIPLPWDANERPTTDLYPFSLGTGVWFDTLTRYLRSHALPLVVGAAALVAIAAMATTRASRFNFFVLGFGSFLLESLVLFNSFLLLGDPNLSAAVAVGLFLVWNGIGSFLTVRAGRSRWVLAAVPLAVGLYAVTAPLLNFLSIGLPVPIRTLAFALHLAPAGIAAGMMFPIALQRFTDQPVATLFFMDVMGCAMAPPLFWLAISTTGLWLIIAGAAISYALVSALLLGRPAAA